MKGEGKKEVSVEKLFATFHLECDQMVANILD